jgi:hypothetical protein
MMAIYWLIIPYKSIKVGPRNIRYCAIADFAAEIKQADGDWKVAEIDGDRAIVRLRADDPIKNIVLSNSDVQITETDRPENYWTPTRISTISGKVMKVESLDDMAKYLLDDQKWGDLKKQAEELAAKYDKEGYQKISRGDWGLTAQLLVYLGRLGYGLNKVSTGTFPTTGVLDNFDRANAGNLGANWSILKDWSGSQDYGIISNTAYVDIVSNWSSVYYNPYTYGADSECFVTLSTVGSTGTDDLMTLYLRATSPGSTFDGYEIGYNVNTSPAKWYIWRVDNGSEVAIKGPTDQAISSGNKFGAEVIGNVITGYIYTGGAWSAVLSESDSNYSGVGNIGFYGTATVNYTDWRLDDFGGGTVIGGTPTLEQVSFRYRDDDDDEAHATWLDSQGTDITRAANLNTRLRFLLQAAGNPPAGQVQIEYNKVGDPDSEYRKI